MLSPDRIPDLAPLPTAAADYDIVRRAIALISEQLAQAARDRGDRRTPPASRATELHHLFRRWAGLTPKAFLQALTLDSARKLLRDSASVLDATYEVGLSGPGRLHDLFVTHEAMSPGEWKAGGEGLTMHYGFHPSPFGTALVMATPRGLAASPSPIPARSRPRSPTCSGRWPKATLCRGQRAHRAARRAHLRPEAVAAGPAAARGADRHRLRGAGLGDAAAASRWAAPPPIPTSPARSAAPKAVARGRRRGRQEPDLRSWCRAIACIGKSGELTGYHWGITRKRAMLGWEAGRRRGVTPPSPLVVAAPS